jgi:hypothetical protein
MSLRKTIEVVVRLADAGIIQEYAIAGAVAALSYIQPTLTEDLDILVSTEHFETRSSGLILLAPIEKALADMGYTERTDVGVVIGDWPVQFIPVASKLDEEALEQAVEVHIDVPGEPALTARCLSAQHLVAIALKVGRPKDRTRIDAFLQQGAVDLVALKGILERHGLMAAWLTYCARAGIEDPLRTA